MRGAGRFLLKKLRSRQRRGETGRGDGAGCGRVR